MREKLDLHKLLNYFGLTILILKDAHVEVSIDFMLWHLIL